MSAEAGAALAGLPAPPPTSSVFCPGLKTEPLDRPLDGPLDGAVPAGAVVGPGAVEPTPLGPAMGPDMDAPSQEAHDEAVRQLAAMVSQCGDDIEGIIKSRNPNDSKLW